MNNLRKTIRTCKERLKCLTGKEMYFRGMKRGLWHMRLLGITAYIVSSNKHLSDQVKIKNNERR